MESLFLLLLQLLETLRKAITITITSQTTYYYYYYFPVTITFIITVKPVKRNTSRLCVQSNIQIPLLLPLYHTLPQTHYHR